METQAELVDQELLIHLHGAEYAALTTRNTYYMSVSFTFWPALILFLTLLRNEWGASLTASIAAIGSELIVAGWYFCLVEQYKNVRYIETTLRPKLIEMLHTAEFWWYESKRHQPPESQWPRIIGDIWGCIIVVVPAIYALWRWSPTNASEWLVFSISIITGIVLIALTGQAIVERRRFESALRTLNVRAAQVAQGAKAAGAPTP